MSVELELSDRTASSGRSRRLVVSSIVGIPIVIGVLVSIVLYSTRPTPVPPPARAPLASPSATDTLVRDGEVLILEPATLAPVSMQAGQRIEIVLNTGVGQTVSTLDPSGTRSSRQSTLSCDAHLRRGWRGIVDVPGTSPRDDAAACDLRYRSLLTARELPAIASAADSCHREASRLTYPLALRGSAS